MKFKPATESEKVVLGALILDPELFSVVQNILCSPDFHYPVHKEIYDCMHNLNIRYGTFDIAMILDNLETNSAYLYELGNECASTMNIEAHATIIREKSIEQKLMECARDLEDIYPPKEREEIKTIGKDTLLFHNKESTELLLRKIEDQLLRCDNELDAITRTKQKCLELIGKLCLVKKRGNR